MKSKEKSKETTKLYNHRSLLNFVALSQVTTEEGASDTNKSAPIGQARYFGLIDRENAFPKPIKLYESFMDSLSRLLHTATPDNKCVATACIQEDYSNKMEIIFAHNNLPKLPSKQQPAEVIYAREKATILRRLQESSISIGNDGTAVLDIDPDKILQVTSSGPSNELCSRVISLAKLFDGKKTLINKMKSGYNPTVESVFDFDKQLNQEEQQITGYKAYFSIIDKLFQGDTGHVMDNLRFLFFPNLKLSGDITAINGLLSFIRPLFDITKLMKLASDREIILKHSPTQENLNNDSGHVHAEVIIAQDLLDGNSPNQYIGISKYSCLFCDGFLNDHNFHYRGWHDMEFGASEDGYQFLSQGHMAEEAYKLNPTNSPLALKKDMYFQDHELSGDEDEEHNLYQQNDLLYQFVLQQDKLKSVVKILNQTYYFLWYVFYKYPTKFSTTLEFKSDLSTENSHIWQEIRDQRMQQDLTLETELSGFQKANLKKHCSKEGHEKFKIEDNPLIQKLYVIEGDSRCPEFRSDNYWSDSKTYFINMSGHFNEFNTFVDTIGNVPMLE